MHKPIALAAARFATAACIATAASAGMYDKPYGLAETGNESEVRKEMRLAITKVDGASTRNARRTDPLEPGRRVLTLHVSTARGTFRPEYLEYPLEVQACRRYRIVAAYETKLGPDWKPKLYEERIGECEKKFMKKDAPAK